LDVGLFVLGREREMPLHDGEAYSRVVEVFVGISTPLGVSSQSPNSLPYIELIYSTSNQNVSAAMVASP